MNMMLLLSGICGTIAFFVAITKTISKRRKSALLSMELSAMFLLIADRFAYAYRGNTEKIGFLITRVSNFFVYFLTLLILWTFNNYLKDLYEEYEHGKPLPKRLKVIDGLLIFGEAMLVVSQFTGFYYTFDENNCYQRGGGFILCYAIPVLIYILQLTVIVRSFKSLHRNMWYALLLFSVMPLIASVLQLFFYGLSLINITLVGMIMLLYIFSLLDANKAIERAKNLEITLLRDEQEYFRTIFVQTAEALASAIDAKDKYTHGHSRRVAEYSVKIARLAGLDSKACDDVYFAALLHDTGKIGIPDTIINKERRLTDEEFAEIKKHPIIGKQILSSISRSPFLGIGANYHHERYDGKGYPEGLKGEEIPDIARIIAVADAYDAMTSKRSYRDPLPQQLVREEFVKGIGTQFDPKYAEIMIRLIDMDSEYHMKERQETGEVRSKKEMRFDSYRSAFSDGIRIANYLTKIRIHCKGDAGALSADPIPSLILFDSLDARVHDHDAREKELLYLEYCEIRLDGHIINGSARDIHCSDSRLLSTRTPDWQEIYQEGIDYEIEAVRFKDHLRIRIKSDYQYIENIIALPYSSLYSYISFTGQDCIISNIKVSKANEPIGETEIPRIADEISYIQGPVGDIPNLQIDGWRSDATLGIPLGDQMELNFNSMSLPTARLVWHCPFVLLFSADDRKVEGKNYRELVLIRMDGECCAVEDEVKNTTNVTVNEHFGNWETWKQKNKDGITCRITICRKGNTVTTSTQAAGITTYSVTTLIHDDLQNICVALTGDQCALTDIHVANISAADKSENV